MIIYYRFQSIFTRLHRASIPILSLSLLAAAFTGCTTTTSEGYRVPSLPAVPYEPGNVFSLGTIPEGMIRVAVLPVHHPSDDPGLRSRADAVVRSEFSKTRLFESVPVSRDYLIKYFGATQVDSAGLLPDALLERVSADFGADGVLFVDLTHYDPYRPISMGLRSKLVDLRDGEIIWVFDDLLDAGEPAIQSAVRRYAHEAQMEQFPQDTADSMLQSPSRFMRYVAHAAFHTLPSR